MDDDEEDGGETPFHIFFIIVVVEKTARPLTNYQVRYLTNETFYKLF